MREPRRRRGRDRVRMEASFRRWPAAGHVHSNTLAPPPPSPKEKGGLAAAPGIPEKLRQEGDGLLALEDLLREAADLLLAELEEQLLFRLLLGLEELLGHVEVVVVAHAGAGGDHPSHDDVLLEAAQAVHLAADRGLGEHPRGLLEARRRDEAVGRQRRLGDAEEQRPADGGGAAGGDDALVLLAELPAVHLLVDQELAAVDLGDDRRLLGAAGLE